MTYVYEIFTDDKGITWTLKADGILHQDVRKDVLIDMTFEIIKALEEIGCHSQLIIRDEKNKISYRGEV